MPKRLDYPLELESLKKRPANELRPISTRVRNSCACTLYEICYQMDLEVSALAREIIEAQADRYLASETWPPRDGQMETRSASPAEISITLSPEIRALADQAAVAIGMNLPTLLEQIICEALPSWALRASKAKRQREEAVAQMEGRETRARAVWNTCRRLAPSTHAAALDQVDALINQSKVNLELDQAGTLILTCIAAITVAAGAAENPEIAILGQLVAAGVLIAEGSEHAPGRRWKLSYERIRSHEEILPLPVETYFGQEWPHETNIAQELPPLEVQLRV